MDDTTNKTRPLHIVFVGNFHVDYSSETHHAISIEELGHTVRRMQEGVATADEIVKEALQSDLLVWVHTHGWETPSGNYRQEDILPLLKGRVPTVTYHLDLWIGLQRQKDLENDTFYKDIDYFYTCDKIMADWFNTATNVNGRYLPAAVFGREAKKLQPTLGEGNYKYDVIFVGSRGYHPEWQYRPQLVDWLQATYGDRFAHFGNDGKGVVRGLELNQLYADTKVVVGDSLNINYNYPYYWSDRLYETVGRGGFIIFPHITGIDHEYNVTGTEKRELVTYKYSDFETLKGLIDFYLNNDQPREMIRERGYRRTIKEHTYKHRWEKILHEVING